MTRINQKTLIRRAFKLSLSNLFRNKFLSIATVSVIGITLFVFNIILAINFVAESSLSSLSEKVDITLYLKESTTTENAKNIIDELKLIDGVKSVSYTSKEEALQKIKTTYPNIYNSFTKYDLGNPLPASISISTLDPSYHKIIENYVLGSKISLYISNIKQNDTGSQEESIISSVAKNLQKVTDFSRQIIFWLVIIFVIGGILIVLNSIQITIFSRRKEVNIMRLVGAPLKFIYLPFIFESIMYAILAILLNIGLLWLLSKQINFEGTNLYDFSQNLHLTILTLIELVVTVTLSVGSSLLAVRNYLRRPLTTEE